MASLESIAEKTPTSHVVLRNENMWVNGIWFGPKKITVAGSMQHVLRNGTKGMILTHLIAHLGEEFVEKELAETVGTNTVYLRTYMKELSRMMQASGYYMLNVYRDRAQPPSSYSYALIAKP